MKSCIDEMAKLILLERAGFKVVGENIVCASCGAVAIWVRKDKIACPEKVTPACAPRQLPAPDAPN